MVGWETGFETDRTCGNETWCCKDECARTREYVGRRRERFDKMRFFMLDVFTCSTFFSWSFINQYHLVVLNVL